MSEIPVLVDKVRESPTRKSLSYQLSIDGSQLRLGLYSVGVLDVAVVSNNNQDLLSILMSIKQTSRIEEARTLIRFGPRNTAVTHLLRPQNLSALPLPSSDGGAHWMKSKAFRLSNPTGPFKLITHPPVGGFVAKGVLEDAFCKPSITVQLNSALNACFRALCSYTKCVSKYTECRDEAAVARAYCMAVGSEDG